MQPALLLACGAIRIVGLGVAQRAGFIWSGDGGGGHSQLTAGTANTRYICPMMPLCASISGTVIEKMAVEGQYVKVGDAIYQLAGLSTVWLMLKLFPEDAVTIRYGQKVNAEVQSLPGRKFTGRAAFIDPNVDPETRTVGVRVVIPNDDGLLRVGDYAKATIDVPLSDAQQTLVYDVPRWPIKD